MLVVVSPHCDDAVLSLGQFLAANDDPDTIIATVYAGVPERGVSEYDAARGYTKSSAAMIDRRLEDAAAIDGLGVNWLHGDFFDAQYRLGNDETEMRDWLRPLFGWEHHTFVPLGVGHPDHRTVARLCRQVAGPEALLYSELPYRVMYPEQEHDALNVWRAQGWIIDPVPYPLAQGEMKEKRAALDCYRSQWPDGADDPCFYVPERAWRATR